jgi:hypothetical protein
MPQIPRLPFGRRSPTYSINPKDWRKLDGFEYHRATQPTGNQTAWSTKVDNWNVSGGAFCTHIRVVCWRRRVEPTPACAGPRASSTESQQAQAQEIQQQNQNRIQIVQDFADFSQRMLGVLENPTEEVKREVIRLLVDHIVVKDEAIVIHHIVPISENKRLSLKHQRSQKLLNGHQEWFIWRGWPQQD